MMVKFTSAFYANPGSPVYVNPELVIRVHRMRHRGNLTEEEGRKYKRLADPEYTELTCVGDVKISVSEMPETVIKALDRELGCG
jgi:hypothetical protein